MDLLKYNIDLPRFSALAGRAAVLTAVAVLLAAVTTGAVYHHFSGSGLSDGPAATVGRTKKGPYDGYHLDSRFAKPDLTLTDTASRPNPGFIGLTGDFTAIQQAGTSLGIYMDPPVVSADGTVSSTHGAQVLAFIPSDNQAHVLYLSGAAVTDYEHDLPLIVRSATS